MKLDSNNHSAFSLNYHLVLCVKYRRKALTDPISDYASNVFERIGENYRISIMSTCCSRRIPIQSCLKWKEYFWSQSFCLITVGGAPLEVLQTYIENQGKEPRHR